MHHLRPAPGRSLGIAGFNANGAMPHQRATPERHASRLARALAGIINVLDPDVSVPGGGVFKRQHLYRRLPQLWMRRVFSGGVQGVVRTRLVPARHGDASGVHGAAWLWREG